MSVEMMNFEPRLRCILYIACCWFTVLVDVTGTRTCTFLGSHTSSAVPYTRSSWSDEDTVSAQPAAYLSYAVQRLVDCMQMIHSLPTHSKGWFPGEPMLGSCAIGCIPLICFGWKTLETVVPSPPTDSIWALWALMRLGGKINNQNCSMLYCERRLCTLICTHIWTVLKFACWFTF